MWDVSLIGSRQTKHVIKGKQKPLGTEGYWVRDFDNLPDIIHTCAFF